MEDYPRSLAELETRFGTEQACRDYLMKLRMASGIRLSPLQYAVSLGNQPKPAGVYEMSVPGISHGGHDISGYAETTDIVVPGNLVGYRSEEWCQRLGCATDSGTGQLHHGMDLAA
jgi:hypothetical protein